MSIRKTKKELPFKAVLLICVNLAFDDFENIHGASLYAEAAGDALSSGVFVNNDLEGADFSTLAAANAELLINNVNALSVLLDRACFTNLSALTALDADHGLGFAVLFDNLDSGLIGIKYLIVSFGTCTDASEASHASCFFVYFFRAYACQ